VGLSEIESWQSVTTIPVCRDEQTFKQNVQTVATEREKICLCATALAEPLMPSSLYFCSMSCTKPCSTMPAASGPTELISPYQRCGAFSSHGG
jgi:hypothetical protein